jgi:hypothetical protein
MCRRGQHTFHRSGTVSGAGKAEARQRGWDVAGGHPRFSREAPLPPERPGSRPSPIPVARSRELPDRTKGGGDVPVRRTHRRSLRLNGEAISRKRRAAGGGIGRLQCVRGGKGVCGRFRDTNRCGSLPRHDGRLCATTRMVACDPICDEPKKQGPLLGGAGPSRSIPELAAQRCGVPQRRWKSSWTALHSERTCTCQRTSSGRCAARSRHWRSCE